MRARARPYRSGVGKGLIPLHLLALAVGFAMFGTGAAMATRPSVVAIHRAAAPPNSVKLVAALRQASGLPAADLSRFSSTGDYCHYEAAGTIGDPFPGDPEQLAAALLPQATRYSGCRPDTKSYRALPNDSLFSYPADGATGVSNMQPLIIFAAGPWVDATMPDGTAYPPPAQMPFIVDKLVRSSDGQPVALKASNTQGGIGYQLTPTRPLALGTSYQATVTIGNGTDELTLNWSFTTTAAKPPVLLHGCLPEDATGDLLPCPPMPGVSVALVRPPAVIKAGTTVTFRGRAADKMAKNGAYYDAMIYLTAGKALATVSGSITPLSESGGETGPPGTKYPSIHPWLTWKARKGSYNVCLVENGFARQGDAHPDVYDCRRFVVR